MGLAKSQRVKTKVASTHSTEGWNKSEEGAAPIRLSSSTVLLAVIAQSGK
jgi:hypothetical protein